MDGIEDIFEITFHGMKEDDKMQIRKYQETDLPEMTSIWNKVVEDGIAFPQEECLTRRIQDEGRAL